jgi:hypothetical protein
MTLLQDVDSMQTVVMGIGRGDDAVEGRVPRCPSMVDVHTANTACVMS